MGRINEGSQSGLSTCQFETRSSPLKRKGLGFSERKPALACIVIYGSLGK